MPIAEELVVRSRRLSSHNAHKSSVTARMMLNQVEVLGAVGIVGNVTFHQRWQIVNYMAVQKTYATNERPCMAGLDSCWQMLTATRR